MARPPKAKAIERLQRALDVIPELRDLESGSPQFMEWREGTLGVISRTFGGNSDHIKGFKSINFSPPRPFYPAAYEHGLNSASAKLKSMIKEIEEDWPDDKQAQISSSARGNDQPSTKEIFVVHGRDKDTKNTVARFLEKLKLMPVILSEIPGKGRTIIEKFEQHAQVGFAIVLLTPDDAGSLQGDTNLSPRARQNVIFELGFFIGRLDRKQVCALTRGEVEIPSDYAGIEYIRLDASDGWQMKLFEELQAAGMPVDPNDMFQT